jgi:hypothetical protein
MIHRLLRSGASGTAIRREITEWRVNEAVPVLNNVCLNSVQAYAKKKGTNRRRD